MAWSKTLNPDGSYTLTEGETGESFVSAMDVPEIPASAPVSVALPPTPSPLPTPTPNLIPQDPEPATPPLLWPRVAFPTQDTEPVALRNRAPGDPSLPTQEQMAQAQGQVAQPTQPPVDFNIPYVGGSPDIEAGARRYESGVTAEQGALDTYGRLLYGDEGLKGMREGVGSLDRETEARNIARDRAYKATTELVEAQKEDPTQFFSQLSGGQRLIAALSLIAGSVGQALAGGENAALKIINEHVNNNIAAQRGNIAKQRQDLEFMRRNNLDAQDLYKIKRAGMLDMIAKRAEDLKSIAQTETQRARLDQAAGKMRIEVGQIKDELALKNAGLEVEGQKAKADITQKQAQTERERTLPVGSAEQLAALDTSMALLDSLSKDFDDKGMSSVYQKTTRAISPNRNTAAGQYKVGMVPTVQTIGYGLEGGKVQEADYARYERMLPLPGDSKATKDMKVRNLRSLISQKKSDLLKSQSKAGFSVGSFDGATAPVPESADKGEGY